MQQRMGPNKASKVKYIKKKILKWLRYTRYHYSKTILVECVKITLYFENIYSYFSLEIILCDHL